MMQLYNYRAHITKVRDGDTVEATLDLGFKVQVNLVLRLAGLDAPEVTRPKTAAEKEAGIRVASFLGATLLQHAGRLYVSSTKIINDADIYDRYSAYLYYLDDSGEFISINDLVSGFMVNNHLTKVEVRAVV